jgi:hypothetical protein
LLQSKRQSEIASAIKNKDGIGFEYFLALSVATNDGPPGSSRDRYYDIEMTKTAELDDTDGGFIATACNEAIGEISLLHGWEKQA